MSEFVSIKSASRGLDEIVSFCIEDLVAETLLSSMFISVASGNVEHFVEFECQLPSISKTPNELALDLLVSRVCPSLATSSLPLREMLPDLLAMFAMLSFLIIVEADRRISCSLRAMLIVSGNGMMF